MSNQLEYTAAVTGFDKVDRALQSQANGLQAVSVAAGKYDAALKKTNASSNQATTSLGNLSRVVQDAPFGFIAISNNINPLLESFQRLKDETGSTGSALKALAGSLIGGGGLGLAISAVTSLLTVFALNNRGAGDEVKAHKTKVDEAAQAQNEYADAVKAASAAIVGQQQNISDLNRTLSDTSNLYNEVTASVVNAAVAQFLATQKDGTVQKLIEAQVKLAQDELKKSKPFFDVPEFNPDFFSKDTAKRNIAELKAQLATINNAVKDLGLEDLFKRIFNPKAKSEEDKKKLTVENVLKELGEQIDFFNKKELVLNISQIEEKKSALKSALDKLLKDLKLDPFNPVVQNLVNGFDQLDRIPGLNGLELRTKIREKLQLDALQPPIEIKIPVLPQIELKNPPKYVKDFTEEVATFFRESAEQIAAGFGETLGNALTGNASIGDFFEGIFRVIAGGLKKLGKAVIVGAELIKKIKEYLAFKPQLALVAGIALIAVGTALENALSKQAFATGTRFAPGGLALVGERGPELMSVPRGAQITPAAQTANLLGGMGGAFIAETRVAGSDLLLVLKRAEKSYSRTA